MQVTGVTDIASTIFSLLDQLSGTLGTASALLTGLSQHPWQCTLSLLHFMACYVFICVCLYNTSLTHGNRPAPAAGIKRETACHIWSEPVAGQAVKHCLMT